MTPWIGADTLFADEARDIFGMLVDTPVGDPFAVGVVSGASLIARLPKIWIGYLLAFATLIGETVAVARNPELAKNAAITAVPLEPEEV